MPEDRDLRERVAKLEVRVDNSDKDIVFVKSEIVNNTKATILLTQAMEKMTNQLKGGTRILYAVTLFIGFLIDELVHFVTRH